MALQRAHIEPDLLLWARETRGFTVEQAAKTIGVKPERILEWERGEIEPTVRQLRNAAHAYKRPIGLLFLPERPEDDEIETIRDFRRITDPDAEDFSPALRLELRLAQERRLEAIELAIELGDVLPAFPLAAGGDDAPASLGVKIRNALDIKPFEQFSWSDGYEAFNSWRAAIERLGVLVFQTGGKQVYKVSSTEARGFSLAKDPFPVIVVNSSDAITARCFTLMHELTHIVLRAGGLCDLHESGVEAYCNRVAAAVLVPADILLDILDAEGYGEVDSWQDGDLRRLANRFKVSWESMLLRLLEIDRTTQEFYDAWRRTHDAPRTVGGFLLPHTRAVMRNGRLLPRIAFDAHFRGYLTLNDLSALLGENVQHVDRIASQVFDARYMK